GIVTAGLTLHCLRHFPIYSPGLEDRSFGDDRDDVPVSVVSGTSRFRDCDTYLSLVGGVLQLRQIKRASPAKSRTPVFEPLRQAVRSDFIHGLAVFHRHALAVREFDYGLLCPPDSRQIRLRHKAI